MNLETAGRWLLIAGLVIVLVGGAIWLLGRLFPNLSDLPGTLRIQGSGFTCIIPILGSIILSVLLTIVLNLLAKLFK
ncbi:MAG TPA: DUF2905 domain-containing protein [Anaerolinea sp.]|nr:DUF2905 domain-containing protein [Anaerolinea sp.]